MANLYKKPTWKTNRKTGQKVRGRSNKWWGKCRDASGTIRRVPLAADKGVAQTMLNEIVRKVEREKAGLVDPFEDYAKQPLNQHVDAFEAHLLHKGNTAQHVHEVVGKVRKVIAGCKWTYIRDLSPSQVQRCLAELRADGLSAQTSNHYLRAIKQFSRWLVRDRRTGDNPLAHLAMLNVKVDRRHDRRALSAEEFSRLVAAAAKGPSIEAISGPDRAMIYVLAAWTGFRKGEIGSLTMRSFRLDDDPPTATVAACYSKRKRQDTQILHPEVVRRLKEWLATKPELGPDGLLFPVSGRVPGGKERKTNKMMRLDLQAARDAWIKDAKTPEERQARERSDFLKYQNDSGLFADFHSNRHLFITSLERVGIRPKMAQTLARHSDIRLTLGAYTHVDIYDQAAAIASLPPPPSAGEKTETEAAELRATGTEGGSDEHLAVPSVVPCGARIGAHHPASKRLRIASNCTEARHERKENGDPKIAATPDKTRRYCTNRRQSASLRIAPKSGKRTVHPTGLEPVTFGSVDRCSIQLS